MSSHQGARYHTAQVLVHGTMLELGDAGLLLTAATRVTHTLVLIIALSPRQMQRVPRQPILNALMHPEHPIVFHEVFRDRLRGYQIITPDAAALRAERASNLPRANGALYERAPAELHVHLTGLQEPVTQEEVEPTVEELPLAPVTA